MRTVVAVVRKVTEGVPFTWAKLTLVLTRTGQKLPSRCSNHCFLPSEGVVLLDKRNTTLYTPPKKAVSV